MNDESNNQGFQIKTWHTVLFLFLVVYGIGKCSQSQDANKTNVYKQSDRTEIYYNDENGNVTKRETIYKDGRPKETKKYK